MKRRKLSARKSKRIFRKTAAKTHPRNLRGKAMMRGGTRF